MTDTTTPAPTDAEILAPAAYRLKDDEATKHYGKDVYVYYTPNEFKTPAAFKYLEPLYTAPPAQEARVPLSDDQIDEIHLANRDAYERGEVEYESHGFARAVEAAHGIGIAAAQQKEAP